MIVREHEDEFIMIEQQNHAYISAEIMNNFKRNLFIQKDCRPSVAYAIANHDCGWVPFDKEPFWDDKGQAPYNFVNFPYAPKLALYTYGINKIEFVDPYAAALCSVHYVQFLRGNEDQASMEFVKQETERQNRILSSIPTFNQDAFDFHYALLQLGDNLSLYLCLHDPEPWPRHMHPFFKNGLAVSNALKSILPDKLYPLWKKENTILIDGFPSEKPFSVSLKQKTINKETVTKEGLIMAYTKAPYEEIMFHFNKKNSEK